MRSLQQSTAYALMVFMTDSADHVTGKTGATLTISASKAGAAFSTITPTVTERGGGWYNLDLTTAHTDTLGDLALNCTASAADPTDLVCQVQVATATAAQQNTDAGLLDEIHRIHGLKSGEPMTVTPTTRVAGTINQTISGDGVASSTVARV